MNPIFHSSEMQLVTFAHRHHFLSIINENYLHRLQRNDGVEIELEGAPTDGAAIALCLYIPHNNSIHSYDVRFLMEVVSKIEGKEYGFPSLTNQLEFLENWLDYVIQNTAKLKPYYDTAIRWDN